jgi:DME family drug/metabolite transporter
MSIGYLLFGHGLRTTPASAATGLSLLEPAVAALLADLIAHQHLPALGWLGIALVVASVLLQTHSPNPTPALHARPGRRSASLPYGSTPPI